MGGHSLVPSRQSKQEDGGLRAGLGRCPVQALNCPGVEGEALAEGPAEGRAHARPQVPTQLARRESWMAA